MIGLQRHLRRATLARLKGNAAAGPVAPTSMYTQTVPASPAWPFVKLGVPQVARITATCLNGGSVTLPIDGFAKPRYSGAGAMIETAEDHASRIGEWVEATLHLRGAEYMADDHPVQISWKLSDIRLFLDGAEMDAFHWSALVNARMIAE